MVPALMGASRSLLHFIGSTATMSQAGSVHSLYKEICEVLLGKRHGDDEPPWLSSSPPQPPIRTFF